MLLVHSNHANQKTVPQGYEPRGTNMTQVFREDFPAPLDVDIATKPYLVNDITSRRVSHFSHKVYVSGGTSLRNEASDPIKRCVRLWSHLNAIYGACLAKCWLGALNLATGRVGYDKSHVQVYGDLILRSPTAWCLRVPGIAEGGLLSGVSHA